VRWKNMVKLPSVYGECLGARSEEGRGKLR